MRASKSGLGIAAAAMFVLAACASILGVEPLEVDSTKAHKDGGSGSLGDAARTESDAGMIIDPSGGPDASVPKRAPLPQTGTFSYDVQNGSHERLSETTAPHNVQYPSPAKIVVEPVAGNNDCVTLAMTLRASYTETYTWCVRGPELVQERVVRAQTFPLAQIDVTVSCTPGDVYFVETPSPGQRWQHNCTGTMTDATDDPTLESTGTHTFIGEEELTLASGRVKTLRFKDNRQLTGAQQGTYEADLFMTRDGRLVKLTRIIDIRYDSKTIGPCRYIEQETLTLR